MDQERIVSVLRRIGIIIADAVRSYESSHNMPLRMLQEANDNLNRISSQITQDTYNSLSQSIDDLFRIDGTRCNQHYMAPRINCLFINGNMKIKTFRFDFGATLFTK